MDHCVLQLRGEEVGGENCNPRLSLLVSVQGYFSTSHGFSTVLSLEFKIISVRLMIEMLLLFICSYEIEFDTTKP